MRQTRASKNLHSPPFLRTKAASVIGLDQYVLFSISTHEKQLVSGVLNWALLVSTVSEAEISSSGQRMPIAGWSQFCRALRFSQCVSPRVPRTTAIKAADQLFVSGTSEDKQKKAFGGKT